MNLRNFIIVKSVKPIKFSLLYQLVYELILKNFDKAIVLDVVGSKYTVKLFWYWYKFACAII